MKRYTIQPTGKQRQGYTLVEMLVVITIIAILAGVVSIVVFDNLKVGRDAERQTDLQVIATAIEEYKRKHGRYPEMGCIPLVAGWSRQQDCYDFAADLGTVLPQIPRDPSPGSGDGYVYRTNTEGSVFKLMARGSVEDAVTADHPLQACDPTFCDSGCTGSALYSTSYAIWGGFADGVRGDDSATADVICAM